jgi:hypothetical protein
MALDVTHLPDRIITIFEKDGKDNFTDEKDVLLYNFVPSKYITDFSTTGNIFEDLTEYILEYFEKPKNSLETLNIDSLYQMVRDKLPGLTLDESLMVLLYALLSIPISYISEETKKIDEFTDEEVETYEDKKMKIILEALNSIYSKAHPEKKNHKWDNGQELIDSFSIFARDYIALSKREMKIFNNIENFQKDMKSIKPLVYSEFVPKNDRYAYQPYLKGKKSKPVQPSDGIDIFNEANISLEIPYINYTDSHGNTYHKIYNFGYSFIDFLGKIVGIEPEVIGQSNKTTEITWLENKKERKNLETIEFAFLMKPTVPINKLKKDYEKIVYNLSTNEFSLDIDVNVNNLKNIYDERLSKTFEGLDFSHQTQTHLKGSFNIYGTDIKDYSFQDKIYSDPLYQYYIHANERTDSFASKKHLKIHFNDLYNRDNGKKTNTFTLKSRKMIENLVVKNKNKNHNIDAGTDYIKVKVSGENREKIDYYITILTILLTIYAQDKKNIDNFYCSLVPALCLTEKVDKNKTAKKKNDKNTVLNIIREVNPEMFSGNYSRLCGKIQQPIIIQEADRDKYEETIDYPKPGEHIFACKDTKYKYPGLKKNKDKKPGDKYDYVPCCYLKSHIKNSKSPYNQWLNGHAKDAKDEKAPIKEKPKKVKTTVGHYSVSSRILPPGEYGKIPDLLKNFLKKITTFKDFSRLGVPQDPNSAICCLLLATEDAKYLKAKTIEKRIERAIEVRNEMASFFMGLYRQENYDITDTFLKNNLVDSKSFYDPYLYYRGLEEYFDVNIYTFKPGETDNEVDYQIPRSKIFYSNPRKDRKAVLLYVHRGTISESRNITYPQCELILVSKTQNGKVIGHEDKIFDEDVNSHLYHSFILRIKNKSWFIDDEDVKGTTVSTLTSFDDLYSMVNFSEEYLLPLKKGDDEEDAYPKEQIIDDYGKLRALVYYKGSDKNKGLTFVIPPSQPLNMKVRNYKNYPLATYEEAVEFINDEPVSCSIKEEDGKKYITGLWFDLKIEGLVAKSEYLYIPIKKILRNTKALKKLTWGASNPINEGGANIGERTYKLQRTLDLILQLVKWLFIVKQLEMGLDKNNKRILYPVDKFVDEYMTFDTYDGDTADYYNFENIPRILPKLKTVEKCIARMEKYGLNLFKKGKIVMYNEEFYNKIEKYLEEYFANNAPYLSVNVNPHLDWKLPTVIENYYNMADDFKQQENVFVFINDDDFYKWMRMIRLPSYISVNINDTMKDFTTTLSEPYLYVNLNEGKETFIVVQNAYRIDDDLSSLDEKSKKKIQEKNIRYALHICDIWHHNKINVGVVEDMYSGDLPPYIVYGLENDSLVIVDDEHYNGEEMYYPLYVKDSKYAAILRLD